MILKPFTTLKRRITRSKRSKLIELDQLGRENELPEASEVLDAPSSFASQKEVTETTIETTPSPPGTSDVLCSPLKAVNRGVNTSYNKNSVADQVSRQASHTVKKNTQRAKLPTRNSSEIRPDPGFWPFWRADKRARQKTGVSYQEAQITRLNSMRVPYPYPQHSRKRPSKRKTSSRITPTSHYVPIQPTVSTYAQYAQTASQGTAIKTQSFSVARYTGFLILQAIHPLLCAVLYRENDCTEFVVARILYWFFLLTVTSVEIRREKHHWRYLIPLVLAYALWFFVMATDGGSWEAVNISAGHYSLFTASSAMILFLGR